MTRGGRWGSVWRFGDKGHKDDGDIDLKWFSWMMENLEIWLQLRRSSDGVWSGVRTIWF